MLKMEDQLQALNIEDRLVVVEPTKTLEEIPLDDNYPNWVTHIGTQMDTLTHKSPILFLKGNIDLFAWSHKDILGIDVGVTVHHLKSHHLFDPSDRRD